MNDLAALALAELAEQREQQLLVHVGTQVADIPKSEVQVNWQTPKVLAQEEAAYRVLGAWSSPVILLVDLLIWFGQIDYEMSEEKKEGGKGRNGWLRAGLGVEFKN